MISYEFKFPVYFGLLCCLTAGCSSIQPVDSCLSRDEVIKEIYSGSQIEIQTISGEHRSIIVSSISETHIESTSNEQFAIEEIEITGLRKPNMIEKTGAVASVLTYQWFLHVLLPVLIIGLAI